MLNVVALMGRLTHTPELKTTQNGTSVCSFSIAVDRTYTPKGEERKADFIDVVAWRQTADGRAYLQVLPEGQHDRH